MQHTEHRVDIEIAAEALGQETQRLKLTFGGREKTALYLDSPQARALASYLIEHAYLIDVKNSLKQTTPRGSGPLPIPNGSPVR